MNALLELRGFAKKTCHATSFVGRHLNHLIYCNIFKKIDFILRLVFVRNSILGFSTVDQDEPARSESYHDMIVIYGLHFSQKASD